MGKNNSLSKSILIPVAALLAAIYCVALIFTLSIIYSKDNANINSSNISFNDVINSSNNSSDLFSSLWTESFGSSSKLTSTEASETTSTEQNSSLDSSSGASSSNVSNTISSESEVSSSTPTHSVPSSSSNSSSDPVVKPPVTTTSFTAATWIAYYELNFENMNEAQFKAKINQMFDNVVACGNDAVIVHTRSHADAFYRSSLFPMSQYVTGTQGKDPGYDPLKYMVTAAHSRGLQIHAWLNPYRVSFNNDLSKLADSNPAKKWRTDNDSSNDRNVLPYYNPETKQTELHFNPSKAEVRNLIISGIREILDNYDVDGIHLDDYFYPTTVNFDEVEYNQYKNTSPNNKLSLGDWRRANVNTLVSGIYSLVKQYSGVVFGISPSYHISTNKTDHNYTNQYADLALWINTKGYIDYIAPQLYFGYEYKTDTVKYDYILNQWMNMPRRDDIKIYIGLGAYRINGNLSAEHGDEWQTKTDILARQAEDAKNAGADGVFIFDYSSLVSNAANNTAQRENLIETLKKIK